MERWPKGHREPTHVLALSVWAGPLSVSLLPLPLVSPLMPSTQNLKEKVLVCMSVTVEEGRGGQRTGRGLAEVAVGAAGIEKHLGYLTF